MTAGRFAAILAAMLLAAFVLVWVFVNLAAVAYALSQGDGRAVTTYALLAVLGIAVGGAATWAVRRVAGAPRERG